MRFLVQSLVVALAICGVASAAVTVSVREAGTGNSSVNVAPGGTFSVDILVSVADQGAGISGAELNLGVSGPAGGVISVTGPADTGTTSAAINASEWDANVSLEGGGLPMVTGALPKGNYGSGYTGTGGALAAGSSRLMTLQMAVDAGAAEGTYQVNASGLAFAASTFNDLTVTSDSALQVVVGASLPICTRTVVGRYVFYPGSYYGTAVDTSKVALLPGQTATRGTVTNTNGSGSNIISYVNSLTGVYIDVQYDAGCTPLANLTASSFLCERLGRAFPGAAVALPAPTVSVAAHPTLPNTDRITLTWANNTVPNSNWVRIKLIAAGIPGLPADDVHYWGIAKGDGMNDTGTNVLVNTTDQNGPKPPNNHSSLTRALITDVWDFNKDSLVNTTDQNAPKPPNGTSSLTCLQVGVAP